jgi:hypothetical protein
MRTVNYVRPNLVDQYHRFIHIRKYTKTKVQFPDDMSAQKAVYHTWGLVMHQFVTIFENRCRL